MITIFSNTEIISNVANGIDMFANLVDGYLSGINNLKIASIMLMMLAFMMFLFLVIIIYVKSIISFLKSDTQAKGNEDDEPEEDDIFNEEDEEKLNKIIEEQDREKELEKELQKELELARIQKESIDNQKAKSKEEELQPQEKEILQNEAEENLQNSMPEPENNVEPQQKNSQESSGIGFDWKKGKKQKLEKENNDSQNFSTETFRYQQSHKELSELMGLIIDMIGRGVDDLKIAQTIIFRNQGKSSEDDVLQLIDSIKEYISLCLDNHFDKLPNIKNLPSEQEALIHLAKGDTTLALTLLENLMDYNIDKSTSGNPEAKKESLFNEISKQSCTFGTIASIHDIHLATGAFELAVELNPNNVIAWSRLGDMYSKTETNSKAIWAYQNLLKMADEEIYPQSVANANKMMSQYLYAQGNSLQAAKLYNSSKQYYDSLGINRRLDKQEIDIIEIIESHQQSELQATIERILSKKNAQTFEFM